MQFRKFMITIATTTLSVIVAIMAGVLTLTTLPMVETAIAPVMTDWEVTSARVDGVDLIIEGTVIKRRDCVYIPPPRARASDGTNLMVRSTSMTSQISWPAGTGPQRFGPWRVSNGADREVEFFFEHSCHALYNVTSPLGLVQKITVTP